MIAAPIFHFSADENATIALARRLGAGQTRHGVLSAWRSGNRQNHAGARILNALGYEGHEKPHLYAG